MILRRFFWSRLGFQQFRPHSLLIGIFFSKRIALHSHCISAIAADPWAACFRCSAFSPRFVSHGCIDFWMSRFRFGIFSSVSFSNVSVMRLVLSGGGNDDKKPQSVSSMLVTSLSRQRLHSTKFFSNVTPSQGFWIRFASAHFCSPLPLGSQAYLLHQTCNIYSPQAGCFTFCFKPSSLKMSRSTHLSSVSCEECFSQRMYVRLNLSVQQRKQFHLCVQRIPFQSFQCNSHCLILEPEQHSKCGHGWGARWPTCVLQSPMFRPSLLLGHF